MRHRMIKKLCDRSGESIAETLIALLISALALMMLAGAVSTVANLVNRSNAKMNEYYTGDNELARRSGSAVAPFTVTIEGYQSYSATGCINNAFASSPVVAYDAEPISSPAGG